MLVSVSDLATYMDIKFSNRQEDAAEMVLQGLQSELEAYLRRPIEVASFTEEYVLESDHIGLPMGSTIFNDFYATSDVDPVGLSPTELLRQLFILTIRQSFPCRASPSRTYQSLFAFLVKQ